MIRRYRILAVLLAAILLTAFPGRAFAQGSELYTLTHLEAAAERKDAISANMGGVYAATPDYGSGNGAALALIDRPAVKFAVGNTKLGSIQVDGFMTRFYGKVGKVGFMVGTNDTRTNTFTLSGNAINGSETDKVMGIGFPVADNLYVGIQIAPEMSTSYTITGQTTLTGIPVPVNFSRDLKSGVVSGGSYGVLYSKGNFHAGVDYRSYNENTWTITTLNSIFLGGTVLQPGEETGYRSDRMQAAVRVDDLIKNIDVSVGYYDNRFKNSWGTYEFNYTKLQYGANFKFSKAFQLQLGANDGELTTGFSWGIPVTHDRSDYNLKLQFSYARNQFKKLVQKLGTPNPIPDPNHDSTEFTVFWKL
jgi:hypothetical protein